MQTPGKRGLWLKEDNLPPLKTSASGGVGWGEGRQGAEFTAPIPPPRASFQHDGAKSHQESSQIMDYGNWLPIYG